MLAKVPGSARHAGTGKWGDSGHGHPDRRDAARDPTEEAFLSRTGRGLLWGAIAASAVALLLGLALARNLTRPLRRLTEAIHAMAASKLERHVDIGSACDEIGELASAFNSMSTQLVQSNQARRQMTADIAHELRNPLMVMTGYIEALRDGVLRPSPSALT